MSAYDTQAEDSPEHEHTTVVEAPTRWEGPFTEYDKYGEPTGARYVRCTGCGVEVIAGHTEHTTHREGCDSVQTL